MKNYKLRLIIIFWIISFSSFAQLNGNYTIGNTSANYNTITDALTDLQTQGVSGSVVFDIQNGNYALSYETLGTISGISNTNTITFQSESLNRDDVIINGQEIFYLNSNSSYINFKHLTFDVSSSFSNIKRALKIENGANHITIDDCLFTGANAVSTSLFNNNSTKQFNTTFISIWGGSDISIINSSFDINGASIVKNNYNNQTSNLILENNIFNESVTPIYLKKVSNLIISGNQFNQAKYRTIDASILSGDIQIEKNKVQTTNVDLNTYGAIILRSSTSSTNSILVTNNFFSLRKEIYVSQFATNKLYNNSFYCTDTSCLLIENDPYIQDYQLINNVFYTPEEIPNLKYIGNFSFLNAKNNAYSNDVNTILHQIGSNNTIYNLINWKTYANVDQNSLVVENVYVSATDLHTPNSMMLNGSGFSLSQITTDIDQEIRDTTNPDIGADEFNMDYTTYLDLEIVSIDSPLNTQCEDSNVLLSIKNNSSFVISGFKIDCVINDFRGNVGIYSQTLAPNETIQLPITHFVINKNTYYEKLKFYIQPISLKDNNYQNNFKSVFNIMQLGDFSIHKQDDNCGNYLLSVPLIHNTTVLWSNGETTNQILVNQPGNYSVTVTDILGCQITKTITIN